MSVRQTIFDGLTGHAPLTALLADGANSVIGGAAMTGRTYERPFMIYRCQEVRSSLRGDDDDQAVQQNVEIWVYDEPGSFTRIEAILDVIVALVPTLVGLRAQMRGISGELPDDDQKAIVKNIAYVCSERS